VRHRFGLRRLSGCRPDVELPAVLTRVDGESELVVTPVLCARYAIRDPVAAKRLLTGAFHSPPCLWRELGRVVLHHRILSSRISAYCVRTMPSRCQRRISSRLYSVFRRPSTMS